jgi:hypothetical protein
MKLFRIILLFGVMNFTITTIGYGQINKQRAELYDQIKRLSLDEGKVAEVTLNPAYAVLCEVRNK